jgi:hypothetical protein
MAVRKRTAKKKASTAGKLNKTVFEVKPRKLASIKPYENNPRSNEKAIARVAESLTEFGWQQPIVVDGRGVIIAGHTRYEAAKLLGMEVVPVHVARGLSKAQIRAYRIADNATADYSDFDLAKLREEVASLELDGFDAAKTQLTSKQLEEIRAEAAAAIPVEPDIEFSRELLESRNYIVLTFDNDIDWLAAKTLLRLKSVHAKRPNGKPWSKGIGRVVDGMKAIHLLQGDTKPRRRTKRPKSG